jgi:antitoxin (DNA-binding transcriptional repressor) of toxin-antitoxin stability system
MISVGVRTLKDQLSQYLDLVKSGEKIVVTQYNRPIAEITIPSKEITDNESPERKIIRKLLSEMGGIPAKRLKSNTKIPKIVKSESVDVIKLLNETRAERFL